jgi:hypothetical protein
MQLSHSNCQQNATTDIFWREDLADVVRSFSFINEEGIHHLILTKTKKTESEIFISFCFLPDLLLLLLLPLLSLALPCLWGFHSLDQVPNLALCRLQDQTYMAVIQ